MQPADVVLNTGEFHFTHEPIRISTVLGSCVAFTAWHPYRRIGGLCHYLLPVGPAPDGMNRSPRGMYALGAAGLFEDAFRSAGTHVGEYVIKMFGGGNMFPQQLGERVCEFVCAPDAPPTACRDVACKNVTQGREIFESRGFAIQVEDVGGVGSRQLIFDVATGDVWVRRGRFTPNTVPQ